VRVSVILKRIFFCLFTAVIAASASYAANPALNGIDIKKDKNGSYSIILNTERNTGIKKIKDAASGSLTFLVNASAPSENLNITYNNAPDISNVIVQKKNADKTLIVIEGRNIKPADIYIKSASSGILTPAASEMPFLGVNKNIFIFSLGILFMLLGMAALSKIRNRKNKQPDFLITTNKTVLRAVSNKGASVPKEFVINRWLENEKIRKAG